MAMPALSRRRLVLGVALVTLVSGCGGSVAPNSPAPTAIASLAPSAPAPSAEPSVAPVASVAPSPSPIATGSVVQAPTKPRFTFVKETTASNGASIEHYRATWSEPAGAAASFAVYGVTDCLRSSQANDNTPCVTETTEIPTASLKLFASVPGTARSLDVSWALEGEAGPGPYQAVVIVAKNGAGSSSPVVLWSALVCYGCVI
jgi:hypothetical protein